MVACFYAVFVAVVAKFSVCVFLTLLLLLSHESYKENVLSVAFGRKIPFVTEIRPESIETAVSLVSL